jgi:hypothetical protein
MTDDAHDSRHVGSVAEEAARLLGALQGWAREGAPEGSAGAAASTASAALHDLNEHIATGGEDCRYCPVCRTIAALRQTSPEVKDHLATAAVSLLHAATGVLEARGGADSGGRPGPGGRPGSGGRARRDQDPVEKIDLSDDADDTEWED